MRLLLKIGLILGYFASNSQAKTYDFPNFVDTSSKEIVEQEKKTYTAGNSLFFDNQFDGARLNDIVIQNESMITILIEPENEPINESPWYAFKVWSRFDSSHVHLTIDYLNDYRHRYWPKISRNGKKWESLDSTLVSIPLDTLSMTMNLYVGTDTLWVSAQPLETTEDVRKWCEKISEHEFADFSTIGTSGRGRSLYRLVIGKGKETVVLLSRQHPPEVTGYYALKSFVNRLIDKSELSQSFLKKYSVIVYPLVNPDGVDMGHWRHNSGGVDLNRDWAYYNQTEVRQIAGDVVSFIEKNDARVALGLDFHSTWHDIYYTTDRAISTINPSFTDDWLNYIENNLDNYQANDDPSGILNPISRGWFVTQFNAPSITFEIGDDTPLSFIKKKGAVAAEGMMKVLLYKK